MTKSTLAALGAFLLLPAFSCSAQKEAPPPSDSTAPPTEKVDWQDRPWGIGVQASPLAGLSVRYALTERLAAQVAGVPFLVEGETAAGGRLLFQLYRQPTYNFYVTGGGELLIDTENRDFRTGEKQDGARLETRLTGTLGGEYRFSQRLGLGAGLGLAYERREAPSVGGIYAEVSPLAELGLHYYF